MGFGAIPADNLTINIGTLPGFGARAEIQYLKFRYVPPSPVRKQQGC